MNASGPGVLTQVRTVAGKLSRHGALMAPSIWLRLYRSTARMTPSPLNGERAGVRGENRQPASCPERARSEAEGRVEWASPVRAGHGHQPQLPLRPASQGAGRDRWRLRGTRLGLLPVSRPARTTSER